MKQIVLLNCMNSLGKGCTGAACMKAFNQRTGAFQQYKDERLELAAFLLCSGCGKDLHQDEDLQKKINRILEIHPDAVHLGVCTLKKDTGRCRIIEAMAHIFLENGICVINGTHDSPQLPDIGQPVSMSK